MSSLVLELQRDASDGSTRLPDVLRKATMVASKLKIDDVNLWIKYELNGYPARAEVPPYRHIRGDVRAHNPYNGVMMPLRFPNPDFQEKISECVILQSIGSLHEAINSGDSGTLKLDYSEEAIAVLQKNMGEDGWAVPFRMINRSQITSIFDSVRNRILDWTLKLEAEGILGEDMSFSTEEQKIAASLPSIHIGSVENFQGVIGSVSGSNIHIDNVSEIDGALRNRGFSEEERLEIQQLIAEYKSSDAQSRPSIARRGLQWVVTHADQLNTLATMLRDFFGS